MAPIDRRSPARPIWRTLWRERRGAVAILIAVALPILIGFAGLGVETGLWYAIKVQNQAATDNAALSAAIEIAAGKACADYSGLAAYAAAKDGFTPTNTTFACSGTPNCTTGASTICVNSPPTSGSLSGNSRAVEVTISQQQGALLTALYLPSVTIQTRSVASVGSQSGCVVALNSGATANAVSVATGTPAPTVNIPNCWVAANSTATSAVSATGTGILCVYGISTSAASISPTPTTVTDCSSPAAGISVINPVTTSAAAVSGPAVSYTPPSGSCVDFGLKTNANTNDPLGSTVIHVTGAHGNGPAVGMFVADLSETSATIIQDGTTVTAVSETGSSGKFTVTLSQALTAATTGNNSCNVANPCDQIQFTAATSLANNTLYCAPVGLVTGNYALSGVYYIFGEDPGTHGHKGVSLRGVSLYAGNKATITSSGAVTFISYGTAANPAGAIDINCSFPFTTGSMALTAPSAAFTPSLGGSIPAGMLIYQDPSHTDTTTANGSANCQTRGHNNVRNTMTFGSGLTLSDASIIYTPGAQFDFSGTTASLCTILIADTITFGLNTAVTTNLAYPFSACSNLSPPSISSGTSLAE